MKMAVESLSFVDSVTGLDCGVDNRSTGELISLLKSSFRDSDFAKVESILTEREAKLAVEMETTATANEWLKDKLDSVGMEKHELEKKLRKAENMAEFWKNKFQQLESRLLKLEADTKLLLNGEPSVGVSAESGKNMEMENKGLDMDAVNREANVHLEGENAGPSCEGNMPGSQRPASRNIVDIIDSDDDHAPGEILSGNEMTSQRIADNACLNQTSVPSGTGMLKRKLDSCPNVTENKNICTGGDDDKDVDDNSVTADCKTKKIWKLIYEHDSSPTNHSFTMAVSPGSNNKEKICSPSSQEPGIFRRYEEKTRAEHTSRDVPAYCGIEDSSSSSLSFSSSDDEGYMNSDYHFSRFMGNRDDKKWVSEADMLAAFKKDNELYLEAVCALYRQQNSIGKSPVNSSSSSNQGFKFSVRRATSLAEFLIDGDPRGKLRKSVSELLQYDQKGLDDCKKLAIEHSQQLFEIYRKKEDPLFMSQIGP